MGIVKPVSNMNEFFDMEFGKKISNSLSKSKVKYDGQSIYKVEKKTDNQYLKKGSLEFYEVQITFSLFHHHRSYPMNQNCLI